ncbi:kynurenine 3-monooxygenase [Flexibacter flexilis DSM 6793]|uniref:Kynurenine 3-monooxygenase n=1 Tax=Flexibacter flexilis DSM 6793 TaxID=927664 RepID=A0A1I1DDM0_9BACT|nr:NAD(P)/FAD-dependent oxidoreductase [Flexibacter flexilis]SFB73011.1 kynurenine 3-monooxygenase [Flexibacter flexilis DSM 6793]
MKFTNSSHVIIFGGGLVGTLLGLYLARKGCKVDIYERRADMRKVQRFDGRSINLALSDRGWRALQSIGIGDEIKEISIPMYGRSIHNVDGTVSFLPYSKDGLCIYSVSRGTLNAKLLELLENEPNVAFHFEQKCVKVDFATTTATIQHMPTGEQFAVKADAIFGADGAFSAVRASMQKTDRFEYQQHYIDHAYKELNIEALPDGGFALDKNALHIWPRGHYMMIALPNIDSTFTCTLFFPYEGDPSFATLTTPEKVDDFFSKTFPDARPLMHHLEEDFFANPTASLPTIKCYPWTRNATSLIGDAAHGITPFFGQGMNAGFEDCTVLSEAIDNSESWQEALEVYQRSRKPNTDAIAELALQNFIEMRDLVSSPAFILRKKIEMRLQTLFPEKWIPLYSQVTFSKEPYSKALASGQEQDRIMQIVMAEEDIENQWQNDEYLIKIAQKVGII